MATNDDISELLVQVAVSLEMPQSLYEEAVERYQDVGAWLHEKDKELNRRAPEVYPQGSFRLGTIIRPASDDDQYDVDLVYRRDLQKTSTTQAKLKTEAGDHLRDYVKDKEKSNEFVPELKAGRRCWTLNYEKKGFHMDILPAIPNDEGKDTALLITDKKLVEWQHSDPVGYGNWFWEKMQAEVAEQRVKLAAEVHAAVEDVPDWKIKTTLQRAVQILKRHRDMMFKENPDDRPISIIITTLAARAYRRQANLYDALRVILQGMENYVEKREGVYWVPNPVNPNENFADKWREFPQRKDNFYKWLEKAKADFTELDAYARRGLLKEGVSLQLGSGITKRAADNLQRVKQAGANSGAMVLLNEEQVPAPSDISHRKDPPWPLVATTAKVQVKADVYRNMYGTKKLWRLAFPISKKMAIKFVATTNVAPPYEVYWQVVNTGQEAIAEGGLRGGFMRGMRGLYGEEQWETTSYRGTHFMEAFVIKEGRCVARSGQVQVKIR